MIILILTISCALYFFYLYKWTQSCLYGKEPLPHSSLISILISSIFGFIVVGGVFWGYTEKPYGDYFTINDFWIWSRDNNEIWFLFAICTALALSYMVIYHLGYMKADKEYRKIIYNNKERSTFMNYNNYKGYQIIPSSQQLVENGEWTISLYIGRYKGHQWIERPFSAENTYKIEKEAIEHCINLGKKIIDGESEKCTVEDL